MDAPDELRQAITLTEHGDVFIGPQIPGMQVGYIAPSGRAAIADALRAAELLAKVRQVSAAFEEIPWPDALKGPAVDAMTEIHLLLAKGEA